MSYKAITSSSTVLDIEVNLKILVPRKTYKVHPISRKYFKVVRSFFENYNLDVYIFTNFTFQKLWIYMLIRGVSPQITLNLLKRAIFFQRSTTVQKMKFPIKDFSSECDQIYRKLRIWTRLLKKSFMENFIFCVQCIQRFL